MVGRVFILLCAIATAAPAAAAEQRDFCPDRPGQTTPPCTLAPGSLMIETAIAGWTAQADADGRTDAITLGATVLRAGVTPRLEMQIAWAPFTLQRTRDNSAGTISKVSGAGDVSLGFTYGLAGANGPVAVQAILSTPTGSAAIGAGDWGASVRLPVALPLGRGVEFSLTPEVDAAVNSTGRGRHLGYGGAAGIGLPLGAVRSLGIDIAVLRDEDPALPTTVANAGLSLAQQFGRDTQIDLGGTVGLTAASPDLSVSVGIARRF
jgi:hypothetical protein